jgi:hypothetical protein
MLPGCFRMDQSQSQSYFTTSGLAPISSSWRQAPWDSRPDPFFQLNPCGHSSYVISLLTRGWVCHLQLLLALASAVNLSSESRGTHQCSSTILPYNFASVLLQETLCLKHAYGFHPLVNNRILESYPCRISNCLRSFTYGYIPKF